MISHHKSTDQLYSQKGTLSSALRLILKFEFDASLAAVYGARATVQSIEINGFSNGGQLLDSCKTTPLLLQPLKSILLRSLVFFYCPFALNSGEVSLRFKSAPLALSNGKMKKLQLNYRRPSFRARAFRVVRNSLLSSGMQVMLHSRRRRKTFPTPTVFALRGPNL